MKRLLAMAMLATAGTASAESPPRPLPIAPRPLPIASPFRSAPPVEELPPIPFTIDPALLTPAAPAVPRQPFRGRMEGHRCPDCGRGVYGKAGAGPVAGTHWHRCVCGAWWFH